MFKLSNKVALVTGAGSWIGREIAKKLAAANAAVILLGRDLSKLTVTEQQIKKQGGQAFSFAVDIGNEKDVQNCFKEIKKRFKQLDIVVQNAAIYPSTPLEKISLKEWNEVINTNLTGSFIILKSAFDLMKERKQGRIIFISSIAGEPLGVKGFTHYGASKAGVNGLMRSAAIECGEYNITVNCVSPGNICHVEEGDFSQEEIQEMLATIPIKRLGKPDDIANLVLFLASDQSGFITGQNYIVDGGETILA